MTTGACTSMGYLHQSLGDDILPHAHSQQVLLLPMSACDTTRVGESGPHTMWKETEKQIDQGQKGARANGFCARRPREGGSVANARAAKESMIRFTHKSCTAFKGNSSR